MAKKSMEDEASQKDRTTKESASNEATLVCQECLKKGLIIIKAGVYRNVLRFIAPLTINIDQLNEGFDILEEVLKKIDTD